MGDKAGTAITLTVRTWQSICSADWYVVLQVYHKGTSVMMQ